MKKSKGGRKAPANRIASAVHLRGSLAMCVAVKLSICYYSVPTAVVRLGMRRLETKRFRKLVPYSLQSLHQNIGDAEATVTAFRDKQPIWNHLVHIATVNCTAGDSLTDFVVSNSGACRVSTCQMAEICHFENVSTGLLAPSLNHIVKLIALYGSARDTAGRRTLSSERSSQ